MDGGVEFADGARHSQQPIKSLPAYNNKAGFFLHFVIALISIYWYLSYCKMDPVVARRVLFQVAVVAALLHGRGRRSYQLVVSRVVAYHKGDFIGQSPSSVTGHIFA